ncbi:acyltransferase family protein [Pseudomonas sp. 22189]|uniref:acyltransferase family protein n=1 Tax=Pseudomonas sp. 22189 TaxID=3453889 RepID=UPI003F8758E1
MLNQIQESRYESLDGLRGIAALVVVFAHAMLMQPFFWALHYGPHDGQRSQIETLIADSPIRLLWGGDNAVILFFVLSGFVLTLPWTNGRQLSYGSYLISRFCRIYLPYLAAMIISLILAVTIGGAKIPGASEWVNLYAWANNYYWLDIPSMLLMLGNDFSTWINNPTWSLVWEMRVSLLFPLLVFPVIRWRMAGVVAVAAGLWVALAVSQAVAAANPSEAAMLGRPHLTFYYAAFFLMGAVLAYYRDVLIRLSSLGGGDVSVLMIIVGLWIWFTNWAAQAELMKGVGAALIIVASVSAGLPRQFLTTAPVQWLGRVSYSLYLVHVPILLVAEYSLFQYLPHSTIALIAIPAALVIAELFYRAVEGPTHRFGRYLVKRQRIRAAEQKTATDIA